MAFFAHSGFRPDRADWQLLCEHLHNVAELAKSFALAARPGDAEFAQSAYVAGLLHDLGKYHPQWQRWAAEYIRRKCGKTPTCAVAHTDYDPHRQADRDLERQVTKVMGPRPHHSSAGAAVARELDATVGVAMAMVAHHSGLQNISALDGRLQEEESLLEASRTPAAKELGILPTSIPTDALGDGNCTIAMETAIRLLFSCLVDADRHDTAGTGDECAEWSPDALFSRVNRRVGELQGKRLDDRIRQLRQTVYTRCVERGSDERGVFTLTVPTGGGKTLASMAFALKHAAKHGLDRVIVVIPYLSIIEQNAAVYREVLGDDVVLEHHSNVATPSAGDDEESVRSATEDWDARVIVTTSVRFFESLFSNKPSDLRRIHRIANSVIIFDEVQTLPVNLLSPILDMLKRLVGFMRSSVVLCTATQPAFARRDEFEIGLDGCSEIMGSRDEVAELFQQAAHRWQLSTAGSIPQMSVAEVAGKMRKTGRALAILNTKRHARELFDVLQSPSEQTDSFPLFHLSTAMCPAHRREVLEAVRSIPRGKPCLLVATQCVEAGVDLDFPLVMRAIGPLDSCAQAAGRCNREGKGDGEFIIFKPEKNTMPPSSAYQNGAKIAEAMLCGISAVDLRLPQSYTQYFRSLYNVTGRDGWDEKQIQQARSEWRFDDVADNFKLIDDAQSVIVNYGNAMHLLELLQRCGPSKRIFRKLQQYSVSIYTQFAEQQRHLIDDGSFGVKVWNSSFYDLTTGMRTELDIDQTIV